MLQENSPNGRIGNELFRQSLDQLSYLLDLLKRLSSTEDLSPIHTLILKLLAEGKLNGNITEEMANSVKNEAGIK